jgi:hypothetical protein
MWMWNLIIGRPSGNARVSPLPEEVIVTRSILPGEPLTSALVMDDNMIIIVPAPSPAEKA